MESTLKLKKVEVMGSFAIGGLLVLIGAYIAWCALYTGRKLPEVANIGGFMAVVGVLVIFLLLIGSTEKRSQTSDSVSQEPDRLELNQRFSIVD